jgi:hypothetical protein
VALPCNKTELSHVFRRLLERLHGPGNAAAPIEAPEKRSVRRELSSSRRQPRRAHHAARLDPTEDTGAYPTCTHRDRPSRRPAPRTSAPRTSVSSSTGAPSAHPSVCRGDDGSSRLTEMTAPRDADADADAAPVEHDRDASFLEAARRAAAASLKKQNARAHARRERAAAKRAVIANSGTINSPVTTLGPIDESHAVHGAGGSTGVIAGAPNGVVRKVTRARLDTARVRTPDAARGQNAGPRGCVCDRRRRRPHRRHRAARRVRDGTRGRVRDRLLRVRRRIRAFVPQTDGFILGRNPLFVFEPRTEIRLDRDAPGARARGVERRSGVGSYHQARRFRSRRRRQAIRRVRQRLVDAVRVPERRVEPSGDARARPAPRLRQRLSLETPNAG